MGRPKGVWDPRKDVWMSHASGSNVTEKVLAEVLDVAQNYANPVIRYRVSDGALHLQEELRQARREAVQELHSDMGWGWTKIGAHFGISRQRAHQIGNGR
jgi:hypothetical protein